MKKLLLLVAATFSLSAMAYDIANYQYEGTTFNFNYPSADDHSQLTLVNIGNYSQDLIIPDKVDGVPVTVIASNALYDKPYRNLLLPRSLREIQENAILSSSSDFTTLIIPENVEKIGRNAISVYRSTSSTSSSYFVLKHITWMPKNCVVEEEWLKGWNVIYSEKGEILIGKTCEMIPDNFMKNRNISEIVIPYGVKTIGKRAFWGCTKLESVAIGESVTSIGEYAFYDCKSLNYMLLAPATPPTCPTYTFHNVPLDATIEVPCNSISAYASAPEWKYFWAFEETILYKATARAAVPEMGTASVEQDCRCATFTATPAEGYRFKQWSNGSKMNPLTINLTESIELVAEFEDETTGLREIVAKNNAAKVMIEGVLYIKHNDEIYTAQGIRVR